MSDVVLDTHTLLWHLADSPRLSTVARSAIESVIESGGTLYISAVTLVEVLYLEEKGRVSLGTFESLSSETFRLSDLYREVPLTATISRAMRSIPRDVVPDMPDRIIAATAEHMCLPLVTADGRIRSSNVRTIW